MLEMDFCLGVSATVIALTKNHPRGVLFWLFWLARKGKTPVFLCDVYRKRLRYIQVTPSGRSNMSAGNEGKIYLRRNAGFTI